MPSESTKRVNITLSDWEESMLSELSEKYKMNAESILDVGLTFLINELSAAGNQTPCILSSINPVIDENDSK